MNDPSSRARLPSAVHLGRLVASLLVLAGSAAALVPFSPAFPAASIDGSWVLALNEAVARRLAFGKDLVFTFGPYGSVYTQSYHPATDAQMLWSTGLIAAALAAGLICLAEARQRWAAVLLSAFLSVLWLRDPVFLATPLVFLAVVCRVVETGGRSRPWPPAGALAALVLLASASALLLLVKGTFGAAANVGMGLGGLVLLLRGRWRLALLLGLAFLGSVAAFWLLAHQALANLPGFFVAQARIIDGYTEAMAFDGPPWQPAFFALAAVALLALQRPWRGGGALPALPCSREPPPCSSWASKPGS